MKRNSTRSFWMTDDRWYRIVDGNFRLTPDAPEAARRSFDEWKRPEKMTLRKFLRTVRSKLF